MRGCTYPALHLNPESHTSIVDCWSIKSQSYQLHSLCSWMIDWEEKTVSHLGGVFASQSLNQIDPNNRDILPGHVILHMYCLGGPATFCSLVLSTPEPSSQE